MSRTSMRRLTFVATTQHQPGAAAVYFRPKTPFDFQAGQHGLLVVPRLHVKPFSIASAPGEDLIMLGTDLTSDSRFKNALSALAPGATVHLIGPLGNFTVADTPSSIVMLAQGIGITPFRSMLRHMTLTGIVKRTTLLHVGNRHPFRIDTEADATVASYPTSRQAFEQELDGVAAAQPEATFMIAGASTFVRAAAARLNVNGVNASQLRLDTFYGYRGPLPGGNPDISVSASQTYANR